MDLSQLLFLVVFALLLLAAVFVIWLQTSTRLQRLEDKGLSQEQLKAEVERILDANRTTIESTTKTFGEIQSGMGRLSKAAEQMEQLGGEISGLSGLLRAPKFKGGIGELFLGDLLAQILTPQQYALQHTFKSGERVDAVIMLKAGMVPVDSKFPLESFQRITAGENEEAKKAPRREFVATVKRHIDDIARKYILPDEGTFDFALMYIPAENVYYETIIKDEALSEGGSLLNYALQKKVFPVSPNSFYAYMLAIALGFKGLRIEQRAQEIMSDLSRLQGDLAKFRDDFEKVGAHIKDASNRYEDASRRLIRLEDKLLQAGETPQQMELPPTEAPE